MDTDPPRHSVSVSGIITDDHGRALLIQRRDKGVTLRATAAFWNSMNPSKMDSAARSMKKPAYR